MADVAPLVRAQDKATQGIIATLIRLLLGVWRDADPQDRDDVAVRAARSAELAQRAQREARRSMDAYNRQVFDRLDEPFPKPEPADLDDYPREDVTPEEVWARPASAYRYAKSQGKTDEEARDALESKVKSLARDEVLLARRDQAARTYSRSSDNVIGYRRVIHPEKSETGVCGLCVAAATRVYKKSDLLPIHPGCNCEVLPVTKAHDPGAWLNDLDLQALYTAGGSTGKQDLSNVRIREFVDGEMGPMFTAAGKEIPEGETRERRTAPAARGKGSRSTPRTKVQHVDYMRKRLEAYRKTLASLQGRTDDLAAMQRKHIESAIRGTEKALKEAA